MQWQFYKFLFEFSMWQTHILTLYQELNNVVKCHFMSQKWGNSVVVVPTSKRSLGHKGKLDSMQYWDVHVQAYTIEQAYEVVADLCVRKPGHLLLATQKKPHGVCLFSMLRLMSATVML
jgi:hypothetical protein